MDVSSYRNEIAILLNGNTVKALFKDMAYLAVLPIKPLGVERLNGMHGFGKGVVDRLKQEMIMIRHEAIGMQLKGIFVFRLA